MTEKEKMLAGIHILVSLVELISISLVLIYAKPITIEHDCWLAANVIVCGGVTIGKGSVIGAGSVVTRSIPPYSLAAGNPCRVIRELTEDDRLK